MKPSRPPLRSKRPAARAGRAGARPGEVALLLQEAKEAMRERQYARAAEFATKALAAHPNHPDALHILGATALAAGDPGAASILFKRALAAKGSDPSLHVNLAAALVQLEQRKVAEMHLRKALKLKPDNPGALNLLADCRLVAGETEEANRIYEDGIARFPGNVQLLIGCAQLRVSQGEFDRAAALFRRALRIPPPRPIALAGLAMCEKLAYDSPEAQLILRYTETAGLRASEHVALHHAAGEIAARAERHDEAFRHFAEAKKLGREPFNLDKHRQAIAELKGLFTPEFFAARRGYGDPCKRPVFVVGMPRSGTTLVEQIIATHPDAAGAGELPTMTFIANSLGHVQEDVSELVRRLPEISPAETRKLANRYLAELGKASETATRIVDKMPHNFLHLGLIALLFPNAKIVHCRRDPLDTCVSCFTSTLKQHSHPYTADLATLGAYYRGYLDLMAHWKAVLPMPIFELQYEKLVEDIEPRARELLDFIGLPWDPACLAFHETERTVRTISQTQVRQPLYSSSIGRWRRYEKHLGPLREALGDLVDQS